MGCTASKLDNEDTVRRCKERRRFMKDAVYARHHLAASHSDYCRSLRMTGSALTVFAAGEPLSVSDQTPAVLLRTPSSISRSSTVPPPPPRRLIPTPSPPPPPPFAPSPKLPHILSGSSRSSSYRRNRKPAVRLPHILSESSICSSPKGHQSNKGNFTYDANQNRHEAFSTTASQTSSVWNWENFYPPSPPDSEYFQRSHPIHDDDKASTYSSYNHKEEAHSHKHHHIDVEEEEETEREEVHYSEWDDHYNTTTTSSEEEDDEEVDRESRSEMGTQSNFGSSVHNEAKAPPPPMSKSDKSDDAGSSYSWNPASKHAVDDVSDMKMVVRHRDLAEIVAAIKENFDKAAEAGEQVSEMLETSRAQMDRSFSQLKKTVYHSSGVLSSLSSSWTSKPPLAVKYQFEPTSIGESGDSKSLCSSLERLLAWEKKLYEEVKAREGVKIAHEKKLSVLQSQEGRGGDEAKLDKTKASIKRLQSLILVTSQAVATTSSAIIGVRDSELVPQLVELCHGFMYMWKSMNQFHEVQNHIVQQVRGLVNRATKGESTSDLHRQATRDLESAVSAWHSNFCRLIKFQRDFLRSLHGWFKLTLLPVSGEPATGTRESSEAFAFCDEWKLSLDRVPDTVASEAIKSFINVVHSISLKQAEEVKIKKRTESASKELEKKASALRNIEKKYYHSYSMVGIGLPGTGPDNGHALDARDPLSEKKAELEASRRRVEDEMQRYSKAVEVTRAMTLNNIQTGLPGVFQAMTSFSSLIVEALEIACSRSYAIK